MGLALGVSNKILSFESVDITDKCNEYISLLKAYKVIPERVEQAARALKPYEEYLD